MRAQYKSLFIILSINATSRQELGALFSRRHWNKLKIKNWALTCETLGWVIEAHLIEGPKTEWQIQKDANAERHNHRKTRAAGETSGGSAGSSTHTGPGAEEAAEATTPSSTLASSKISTQSRFLIQDIRICHARRLHLPPPPPCISSSTCQNFNLFQIVTTFI